MGVNNIGTNMLPNIGAKFVTKAAFNSKALGSMKGARRPYALASQKGMASSSAKLDPVQVSKKMASISQAKCKLCTSNYRKRCYPSLASWWMKMIGPLDR